MRNHEYRIKKLEKKYAISTPNELPPPLTRSDNKVRAWTAAVKMRDGFECKKCNAKKNLQAHHCIPVNVSPEMVYDINNGITLCRSCHAEFHSKYGHSRCGHYEISEFIGNSETITIDSFCNANRTTHPIIKSTRAPPAYIKTAISIPVNLHNDVKEFASGKPFSTTLCHLVRLGLQFEKMIKDGES